MKNQVVIDPPREEVYWLYMVRWLESAVGQLGSEWDMNKGKDRTGIYTFKREKDALQFDKLWNRTPFILPFKVWEEFCISWPQRGKVSGYWAGLGWTPAVVALEVCGRHYPSEIITGRSHYRPSFRCWFFEFETDAIIDWVARQ